MLSMAKRKPTEWTPGRIRDLRERLGLSVDDAAAKLNVTPRQWFYWEAGTRKPSGPATLLLDLLSRKKI